MTNNSESTRTSATPDNGFAAAAAEAAALLRKGKPDKERAARVLLQGCGSRLIRYLHNHARVDEHQAEDLATQALLSFIDAPPEHAEAAPAYLYSVARSKAIDHVRKVTAQRRGGGRAEVALDEEDFIVLLDTQHGYSDMPAWVRDCVQKAAYVMQQQDPERFMVLQMVYEDWPAEDIAVYFGADPQNVSTRQKTAARDRKYQARQSARQYFEHCQE